MKSFTAGRPGAAILSVLVLGAASPAGAQDGCDRACLEGHMDRFLDALLAHDPSSLDLAGDFEAIYNGKPAMLDSELWEVIDGIAFRQYVMDATAGQVALFGVAVEDHARGTLFVRLAVNDEGQLTSSETIAGERRIDGVPGLISPNPFFDYVLPPSDRRSREELIAIADSYFEGLERHNGEDVPVSDDCRRFEDGVQTSLNPVFLPIACNYFEPFTYMDATADRIYPIVDVERGLVLGQMVIRVSDPSRPSDSSDEEGSSSDGEDEYRPNPLTGMVMPPTEWRSEPRDTIIHELFKIVDGKITEIQTIRLDRPYGWGGGW